MHCHQVYVFCVCSGIRKQRYLTCIRSVSRRQLKDQSSLFLSINSLFATFVDNAIIINTHLFHTCITEKLCYFVVNLSKLSRFLSQNMANRIAEYPPRTKPTSQKYRTVTSRTILAPVAFSLLFLPT